MSSVKAKIKLANSPRTFQGQIRNRVWHLVGDQRRELAVVSVKLGPGYVHRDNDLGIIDLVCNNSYWSDKDRVSLFIAIEQLEAIELLAGDSELRAFPAELLERVAETYDYVDELRAGDNYLITKSGRRRGEKVRIINFPSEDTVLIKSQRGRRKIVTRSGHSWSRL